jgi:hypothetical protein
MIDPARNLYTYKILFLIKGILTLCFSLFFMLYAVMGAVFTNMDEFSNASQPFNPGYIFIIIGIVGVIFSVTLGTLALLASKYIKEQRNYNFIFVVAIVNAITGVLGILLAVFTLIEISKPEVKELFGKK